MGVTGRQCTPTTLLADADIPTLFCGGASESVEGEFDFYRDCLQLGNMCVEVPFRVDTKGRYLLGMVSFDAKGMAQYGRGARGFRRNANYRFRK